MPYFIYKISSPLRLLEKQGVEATFKEAKARTNALRKEIDPTSGVQIKMIFAENELAAEDTLSQPREAEVGLVGDDY